MSGTHSTGPRISRRLRLVPIAGRADAGARPEGKVYLVGAGPGDPELLTRRAARVLLAADVVVYDRLVSSAILDLAPDKARRLFVGKRKSRHALPQADVNALLVALAREGLTVLRLKGGDPFMFGRGGEELLACRAAGVPCEVVPGVSAALAAAASTGVPLTHRGLAQSVTFITGHAASSAEGGAEGRAEGGLEALDLDWAALSRPNHTLAVYMGLSTAGWIAERLMGAGLGPATPVVVVENASLPEERRITARLSGLGEAVKSLEGPAILIIGEVAALAADIHPESAADREVRVADLPSSLRSAL